MKLTANGVELRYELTGPEGAPVVAFSNSLSGTLEIWDEVIPALTGFRCLRYDARAHGGSASLDQPTTIDDLAADLLGLLDGLDLKLVHLVGVSLGGMVCQALASTHPDRVATLTLVATAPQLPPPEPWTERATKVRAEGLAAVVDAVVARWFTPAFLQHEPAAVAQVRERFLAVDPAGYARCCEAIATTDLRDRASAIVSPTLIMVGAEDPVTPPAMAEDLRERISGAELVVLPNVAHLMPVERPDLVAAYLGAFLRRHERSPRVTFEKGLAIRKSVLGEQYVETAIANAGAFGAPWQDFITRIAWGEIWGDPTLPRKTRSLVTLAMMIALHREEEFMLHVRPALANGATVEELRALTIQAAVYTGVPAANAAFRWLREVLGEELK